MGSIPKLEKDIMVIDRELTKLFLETDKATRKYTLGEIRITARNDKFTGVYQYIKVSENVTRGQALTPITMATWTVGNDIKVDGAVVSGATTMTVDGNTATTTAITANQFKGYWIRQAAASGKGMANQIKSHPALAEGTGDMLLTMERAIEEAMVDNVALEIYHPYYMELVDNSDEPIMAVAVEDIDSGQFGWVQVGGFVPAVEVGHTTAKAIILHEPMIPIAANANAGSTQGLEGHALGEITDAFLSPLLALAAIAADTTGFIPAYMKFRG